jgi:hypothetical protein
MVGMVGDGRPVRWRQRRRGAEKSAFRGISPAWAAASNPPYRVRQWCSHIEKMGLLAFLQRFSTSTGVFGFP